MAYKTTWFPEPLPASKGKLANNSCKDQLRKKTKKQRGWKAGMDLCVDQDQKYRITITTKGKEV